MTEKDFDFLLNCTNIEEFKVQCTLAGIDIKEAVKALSFFDEDGKYCIALDHFYWFDENGKQVTPPQKVKGDFCCGKCNSLTSLKGAPQKTYGSFNCSRCTSLTSLEGASKEVGRNFYCYGCFSLTSLKDAPKEVNGDFDCSYCDQLTSLEGAPEKFNGNFWCDGCDSLTSLKGAPQEVCENFSCTSCRSLTSLEGAPSKVCGSFYCSDCNSLTSLKGAPQEVCENFSCASCRSLTSLEGAPQKVAGGLTFTECDSLTVKQIGAYEDWLKARPKQPYHDLYTENKTNESITSIDEFIRSVMNEDDYSIKRCLNTILKSKCKKRLAEVLFYRNHTHICESIFNREEKLNRALSSFVKVTAISKVNDKLVFDALSGKDKYEIICSAYNQTLNASLPDEEEFEILKIEVFEVKESKYGPYHNKKTKINEIECNFNDDDLENAFAKALRVL